MDHKVVVRKMMAFSTRRNFAAGHETKLRPRLNARDGAVNDASYQSQQKSRDKATWWAVSHRLWRWVAPKGLRGTVRN